MTRNDHLFAALAVLALTACGGEKSDNTTSTAPAAEESPADRFAVISQAYADNAIQAKRTWGGKRVVLAGSFDSTGRNPDGSASVLLTSNGQLPNMGEFNLGKNNDDFIAALQKGTTVTLDCMVDPKHEAIVTTFVDCAPAKTNP